MTRYVLMPGAHYQDICNAVREKTGKTQLLRSGEISGEIRGLSTDDYYNTFWDAYQQNGQRVNYYLRFTQDGWNDSTFQPKYPIICRDGATNARSVFASGRMSRIPVPVMIIGIPAQETFYRCNRLETISCLVLEGVSDLTGTFTGCTQLRELRVEGSIDVKINLSAAEFLSGESVLSVLDHLKDLTGLETQTLTLHSVVGGNLSDAQKAEITAKNWTLAY